MTDDAAALVAERVTMRFGGLVAVSQVSFTLARAAVTAMIGPNGAGKTTTFNMISGLLTPSDGRIRFEGSDITGWPPHRIAALGLARTFQNVQLFANLNALETAGQALGLGDATWRERDAWKLHDAPGVAGCLAVTDQEDQHTAEAGRVWRLR